MTLLWLLRIIIWRPVLIAPRAGDYRGLWSLGQDARGGLLSLSKQAPAAILVSVTLNFFVSPLPNLI